MPRNENRDKNVEHVKQLEEEVGPVEERYAPSTPHYEFDRDHRHVHRCFKGLATMEMLVVHPAYWSRGHGTALVGWGLKLAEADGIQQGVLAVGMGAELYPKLGYEPLLELCFEGDEDSPQGLVVKAFIYNPRKQGGEKGHAEL